MLQVVHPSRSLILHADSEEEARYWVLLLQKATEQKPVLESFSLLRTLSYPDLRINEKKFKDTHVLVLERAIILLERDTMKLIAQIMLDASDEVALYREDDLTILVEAPAVYRLRLKVCV